ncbi:translation initiation factor 3 subunit F [Candida albicans SC5314]|uniref:Translation initiation factor 3 subunit F n=1 Tax=Candida albicans P78048 TaxID=1094989 RepID=A0AB34PPG6_CANAX|nr:translation initiation factor 3 subunit F [Candida albicans P94015]KGQ87310.1 translation initiation factor 3 subunit F [Candida albicans P37005]KGR08674.1 translation initiation factor 3 subunit F [Candida albicans P78048]KGT67502.1 translation initiation factor 3 subunit F [Candida albicans 12C]KGU07428.1 translation initiation factor 3 subunit F [Candida albicans 19F]KHC75166.1 translation initiation factor 3 subunit F [Candida albicans SC5314]
MSQTNSFMHLVRPNVIAPAAGSANGPASIKIHAPAMLTILEIISQQVLNKRIIGTLLGSRSDDGLEMEIKDGFMVPINETGDSIAIEDQVHKSLYQLYKKAHPKETVLGWFGSSNQIDDITSLIHDFYSKGVDRAFPFPAIYLNVEFLNEKNQVIEPKITTYIGAAVGKPVSNTQQIGWKTTNVNNSYIFTPIPNEVINATITEKIAFKTLIDQKINQQNDNTNTNTNTNNNNNNGNNNNTDDLSYLSQQLNKATDNVGQLLSYIENNGNKDQDIDLLRLLSNQLLNKPAILTNLPELEKLFKDHNQDVIMIEYLTKAVKDQIELSARLTASAEADKAR